MSTGQPFFVDLLVTTTGAATGGSRERAGLHSPTGLHAVDRRVKDSLQGARVGGLYAGVVQAFLDQCNQPRTNGRLLVFVERRTIDCVVIRADGIADLLLHGFLPDRIIQTGMTGGKRPIIAKSPVVVVCKRLSQIGLLIDQAGACGDGDQQSAAERSNQDETLLCRPHDFFRLQIADLTQRNHDQVHDNK